MCGWVHDCTCVLGRGSGGSTPCSAVQQSGDQRPPSPPARLCRLEQPHSPTLSAWKWPHTAPDLQLIVVIHHTYANGLTAPRTLRSGSAASGTLLSPVMRPSRHSRRPQEYRVPPGSVGVCMCVRVCVCTTVCVCVRMACAAAVEVCGTLLQCNVPNGAARQRLCCAGAFLVHAPQVRPVLPAHVASTHPGRGVRGAVRSPGNPVKLLLCDCSACTHSMFIYSGIYTGIYGVYIYGIPYI